MKSHLMFAIAGAQNFEPLLRKKNCRVAEFILICAEGLLAIEP
jgi:hypothetical protein